MNKQEYLALAGAFKSTSPWIEISQEMINQFADATLDHQFIHIDEARAKAETPFGGTIAHGFLTLSLLSKFALDAFPKVDNTTTGLNYGFDNIRFITPVPSGSRVRATFKLETVEEKRPGEILSKYAVAVEIENAPKPALVAEWLNMIIIKE